MAVYVIASYDIADPGAYEGYVPGVIPLLQKHGAEIVVADFDARSLEGDRRSVYVVLRFATEQAARAWYDDPAYEPIRKIRIGSCTNNNLVIARPYAPSGA